MLYIDAQRDLVDIAEKEIAVHDLTDVRIVVIEINEINEMRY